jgi:hypothetical protein
MCEYCNKKVINKRIEDIDNDNKDGMYTVFLHKPLINATDEDGYKVSNFFKINYCPICGRKLGDEDK